MRHDIDAQREIITILLLTGTPRSEICRRLNCRQTVLSLRLNKWGLGSINNSSRKGIPHPESRTEARAYFNKTHKISSSKLRVKLIEENYKQKKCEICGRTKWNGQPIPLELHHIDCNRFNNNLDNLLILCPNCHAQQPGDCIANTQKCSPDAGIRNTGSA